MITSGLPLCLVRVASSRQEKTSRSFETWYLRLISYTAPSKLYIEHVGEYLSDMFAVYSLFRVSNILSLFLSFRGDQA